MQLMDIGYWRLKLTLECICNPEFTLAEVQRSKAELKCWDLISFVTPSLAKSSHLSHPTQRVCLVLPLKKDRIIT